MEQKNKRRSTLDLSTMVFQKVPPQAKDLEAAILGALMLEPGAMMEIADILKPEHFYPESHQHIFSSCRRLWQRNQPIDILTVVADLTEQELLDAVGGYYYVTKLTNSVVSSANIKRHALIVLQQFIKREFIKIGGNIVSMAYDESQDWKDIDNEFSRLHDELWGHINPVNHQNYDDIVFAAAEEILKNDGNQPPGLQTGFPSLDRILLGLFPHLYIIAARPSMGKTAMIVQLAENITKSGENAVGVLELETTSNAFAYRHLANKTGIGSGQLKRGGLSEEEHKKIYEGVQEIVGQKIYVDFASEQDLHTIYNKCRQWKKKHNVKLIMVDYIQIVQGLAEHERLSREQQVSKLAYGLAGISKELNIPLIAFAQLSREVLKRAGNRPTLGDLRESGSIEAAARVVIGLHRPEYYQIMEDEEGNSTKGLTEVIVLKNNEGEIGTAKLFFQGHLSKFIDMELLADLWTSTAGKGIDVTKIRPAGWKPVINTDKFDDSDTPF